MGKSFSGKKPTRRLNSWGDLITSSRKWLWNGWWHRILTILAVIIIVITGSGYGIAEWYIHKHSGEPLVIGTSFIPDYAQSLGLDPKKTLSAIFSDLGIKQVRLVSYWEDIEKTPGHYDFSQLDWQFAMAQKYGVKVSLAIGLRQPRWPECHLPDWATKLPNGQWQPKLYQFMKAVIERYKNNPALGDYELENEFFLIIFGQCKDFDRSRLVYEYKMVKQTDPNHKVIVSRSNNWVGIPIGQPTPDQFAVSVYKRVWDYSHTHRYVEYPLPPWYYAFLAGAEEMISGKDMIIHEMQAEPWPPPGKDLTTAPLSEQFKSLTPKRLADRIKYAEDTGIRVIDLWGAEWWYWMKVKHSDPSFWNVVKQSVADANAKNAKLL